MDKYEIKIDDENNRIIITDENGLNVAADYEKLDRGALAIVTSTLEASLIKAWHNYTATKKEINEIKIGD